MTALYGWSRHASHEIPPLRGPQHQLCALSVRAMYGWIRLMLTAGSLAQTPRAQQRNAPVDSRRGLMSLMIVFARLLARHAQQLVWLVMPEAGKGSVVRLPMPSLAQAPHAGRRVVALDLLQERASLIIVPASKLLRRARHPVQLDTVDLRRHSVVRCRIPSLAQTPHACQSRVPLEQRQELGSLMIVRARPLASYVQRLV